MSYLLLHAVLGQRVAALGEHLGGVFGQGEKVLEGSAGHLLGERGEVAGQGQGVPGAQGAQLPLSPPLFTAPRRGFETVWEPRGSLRRAAAACLFSHLNSIKTRLCERRPQTGG